MNIDKVECIYKVLKKYFVGWRADNTVIVTNGTKAVQKLQRRLKKEGRNM